MLRRLSVPSGDQMWTSQRRSMPVHSQSNVAECSVMSDTMICSAGVHRRLSVTTVTVVHTEVSTPVQCWRTPTVYTVEGISQ